MNKKIFTGLVVLMGISILGIIAVQLVWMNNAIKVKNELFNRGVNEAISNTVRKLEDIHNFGVVNQMVFNDSVAWNRQISTDINVNTDEEIRWTAKPESLLVVHQKSHPSKPVQIVREFKPGKGETVVEIKIDGDTKSVDSYSYKINSTNEEHRFIVGNDELKSGIIVVRNDTIISDADSLYAFTTVKIDSLLSSFDTLNFVRPDLSKRVKLKAGDLKRMANKFVTEVSEWDVKSVDEELLQEVLTKELSEKNIPIDFEFGIVRDSIVEFPKEVSDSAKVANTIFKASLYPNDIFQKNIQLAVYFPDRGSFVYRSLNWLLIASFFFSLFILITFSLSIFYILRQKKISEMKSDFINNMTHEFKTPIATISVATDSIISEKVVREPDRIKYFAGMIKKENARMNRQVEDILTIARLDRKDFEFNWETIDVHELINDAIQGIILQIEKRGGKIDLKLDALNSMITTDRMHCTNVVYNLIDNAIKYSDAAPEILVETTNQKSGVLISVVDKGIGMTKVVQGKIFERFYRQTSGNIHNVKGFGLGLSYVRAVLEANRGTISVQSEPGKGSKFDVFLPFVRS